MATQIIQSAPKWTPVSINMTFDTPEQLRVFVDIMGNEGHIAAVIARQPDGSVSESELDRITSVIQSLMDYNTWKELMLMVS